MISKLFSKRHLTLAVLLAAAAFVVLVMRVAYPHHRLLALGLYLASWVPFVLSLRRQKASLKKHGRNVKRKVRPYAPHLAVAVLLIAAAYVGRVLVPVEPTPLTGLTDEELRQTLDQDLATLAYLRETLMTEMAYIREHPLVADPPGILSPEDKAAIRGAWRDFLDTSFELDVLQLYYKGFYQVDYLARPELHTACYVAAFSGFCAQYHGMLQARAILREKPHFEQVLNEPDPEGIYDHRDYAGIKQKLTHPKTLLRLNAGRSYLKLIEPHLAPLEDRVRDIREDLAGIDRHFTRQPDLLIDHPLEQLEKTAFKGWFPLQKKVALQMSHIRVKDQDFFIRPELLDEHRASFEPGDILLERRNWYATNVGIPGFWPHSALFVGTPEEMDAYFEGLPEPPSRVLAQRFPELHKALAGTDVDGRPQRVIEAKRPGVILHSLEKSAHADSLAVLRPRISREAKWQALLQAFEHYGKPYDFNFDFSTDQALVCSELICKAYRGIDGLEFKTSMINGRVLFTPNHFARKYAEERGGEHPQLKLILFLDGDEGVNRAAPADEETFSGSWKRPKWHIFTQ